MEIGFKIKDLFQYEFLVITIVFIITILVVLIYFLDKIPKKAPVIVELDQQKRLTIKEKYLKKLQELEVKCQNNSITIRKSYQELSSLIRNFIFEMTGIKVQNYTLSDIKTLKLPALQTLVEEYYKPEFSYKSEGDIISSIKTAREVIQKW